MEGAETWDRLSRGQGDCIEQCSVAEAVVWSCGKVGDLGNWSLDLRNWIHPLECSQLLPCPPAGPTPCPDTAYRAVTPSRSVFLLF